MLTLVFDTETTGKADFKFGPDHPSQPGLVQLGAILYDDRKVVAELNLIVQPRDGEGDPIPVQPEAYAKHGIDDETAARVGFFARQALDILDGLFGKAERVVAYNARFDDLVVATECYRDDLAHIFEGCDLVCAMLSAKPVCKLPNRHGYADYKWPSLDEAYRMLVDPNGFDNAHDAMADVRACAAVLWALEDGGHPLVTVESYKQGNKAT